MITLSLPLVHLLVCVFVDYFEYFGFLRRKFVTLHAITLLSESMKRILFTVLLFVAAQCMVMAQKNNIVLHYDFKKAKNAVVKDMSRSKIDAVLKNGFLGNLSFFVQIIEALVHSNHARCIICSNERSC